ncbi:MULTISPECIES: NADP-dependent phosphogluconate dehydrogenase [Caldilinea]|jgi:6-phosphogluconate dehydrogenase|uniref:6-phosphogluconate dehydrogenase, decarboxylating n=1 Tax=Caldilinea aerophila (strain DSM 14535 / JCM 11387 / NBRC 104270 / STL-6-O1) TaxID=926550 RepID=I0I2T3_CALAS|nr:MULTISPECIES: NADP-dependent phosphogluconate dehydrogenase [Caldilinea]MBO9392661.1 NADP-dependent phosphogluconate dehydrogenase [Caldilinea sp.]BAL99570.1 6-phosphogluconate dehydrogenase [Caldilinea aerophila DSM 14535 = NBRC 104270]GIV73832.1 MAG: 6-phosphogluconate dehydrogenase, decarboxylating [Caldilinea sp.]
MSKADIGLIGLAVMGQNLVLNMERNGYTVAIYNRTTRVTDEFIAAHPDKKLVPARTLEEFVASLERPRKILIMVKAGAPVDAVLDSLVPLLEPGDLVMDGGNSYFMDTERRAKALEEAGLLFMGVGVSGGEEGALWGPSIMPGGSLEGWRMVADILSAIAAKAPEDGKPCVAYMGPRSAGHYVKMVHNGIEYGDMQLIAEAYDILRRGLGLEAHELAEIFEEWNRGELDSYLIDITAQIFRKIDEITGRPLVDLVLDAAGQKGTGKWTSQDSFDIGAPTPTINSAVTERILSSLKAERVAASKVLPGPEARYTGDRQSLIDAVRQALYASKISAYAQGMAMLRTASKVRDYGLNLGEIAAIWRNGCIIRARFLNRITEAFNRNPALTNLLLDEEFAAAVRERLPAWRHVVQTAAALGIPAPAFSASLAYYDSYRSERLPANLIQAQRDFFGAHTYERIDMEGVFHSDWANA